MVQTEIIKYNKLLAEFEGINYVLDNSIPSWSYEEAAVAINREYITDYNDNWGHLMRIVDKIESIHNPIYGKFSVSIRRNTCDIESSALHAYLQGDGTAIAYMSNVNEICPTKIESTYNNVVEFVIWYNKTILNNECK